jgi:hypothetical protein
MAPKSFHVDRSRKLQQAPELAREIFGPAMATDAETIEVVRYFLERELGFDGGIIPGDVTAFDLPPAAELFRIYRTRALGDRPTGRWTVQRRVQKPLPKSKRRL